MAKARPKASELVARAVRSQATRWEMMSPEDQTYLREVVEAIDASPQRISIRKIQALLEEQAGLKIGRSSLDTMIEALRKDAAKKRR